jgi:hypothetical protein
MKDLVLKLYKQNKSAYDIHIATGLGFKEITHYIRIDEEAKNEHKKKLEDRQDEWSR